MPSSGPNSPATTADDASIGTEVWANTGNSTASDNVYATVALGGEAGNQSHYLKDTNFGFSIPSGSTINGIVVEIERKKTGLSNIKDLAVRIVKGGTIGTTDKSNGANWPTADAYQTYGSSSDLWGLSWTASNINATTFGTAVAVGPSGVFVSATGNIDHIRITVYYTLPAGGFFLKMLCRLLPELFVEKQTRLVYI